MQEHDQDVAVFKVEQLFGERDAGGVQRIGANAGALEQPGGIGGDNAGGSDAEDADAACFRHKTHGGGHGVAVFHSGQHFQRVFLVLENEIDCRVAVARNGFRGSGQFFNRRIRHAEIGLQSFLEVD
ncbi:hypothetical protein D3C87_1540530 [compost metagenome]